MLEQQLEAVEYLKRLTELESKNANAYSLYGGCLLSLGMYELALEQFRIASELDDTYWRKYNNVKNAVDVIIEYNNRESK